MEQVKVNVNPAQFRNIRCECGSSVWRMAAILKRVPKLLAGTPVDAILNIQVWTCIACNEILPDNISMIVEPEEAPTNTNILH